MRHMCCVQSFRLGKCTLKSSSKEILHLPCIPGGPSLAPNGIWSYAQSNRSHSLTSVHRINIKSPLPKDSGKLREKGILGRGKGYFGEGKWVARHYLLGQEAQFCQKLLGQCHLLLHVALSQTL